MIRKLCIYSVLSLGLSLTALFPVPSVSAWTGDLPTCTETIAPDWQTQALAKNATINFDNPNGFFAIGYGDGSIQIYADMNGLGDFGLYDGDNIVSIPSDHVEIVYNIETQTVVGAARHFNNEWSDNTITCVQFANNVNYTNGFIQRFPEWTNTPTPPDPDPTPTGSYWTDEKVKDIMTFIFFAVFDILFIVWIWHAFTRD